ENDIEPNSDDQNSMFQSLELVRQHPAYLMAFLQHVVLQFDSCPVLCYLHVDMLRRMNPKEGKKQFLEFCHLFLDKAGVSAAPRPPSPADRTRPELLADDVQRRYLQEIQAFQEPEISRQLEDFRSKRLMGMTPGEQELTELESYQTRDVGIREAKEKQLAEVLLARLEEMHSAIFGAIVTYMKYLGVKTKLSDSKKSKSNFFRKKVRCPGTQVPSPLEPGGPGGGEPPQSFLPPQSEETEPRVSELELDPPTWRQLAAPDALLRLKKSEVKRQEVINELFLTEHAHVRMLRVLLEVFYQPMLKEAFFDEQELSNIFPSLEDLVEVHTVFLDSLKKLREESSYVISEIGDILLARFEGTEGSWFQKISARFCSRQSFALEQLKAKQRKDTRFSQFIQVTPPLPGGGPDPPHHPKGNLVHEGPLTWRVTRDKAVDVHVLLLDDLLVLLQRQEERLVLRCHSRTITPTPDGKQMLSPIIKLSSAMTREVATDHKAFYVIISWENGAQIYELVAQTVSERKNWCAMISETAGSLKLPGSHRAKAARGGHMGAAAGGGAGAPPGARPAAGGLAAGPAAGPGGGAPGAQGEGMGMGQPPCSPPSAPWGCSVPGVPWGCPL
uniref:Rho guanine nucleotide exchange factor 1 n=1 Tax=Apteryx owenii TaxID=8824 RepID=A0A8B9P866_APTOW